MARSALILGSTGLIGRHLLQLLLACDAYKTVVVVARRAPEQQHPKLQAHMMALDDMATHAALFTVDDVFCCLGTTIKQAGSPEQFRKVDYEYCLTAAELARQQGVRRFLQVTAVGSNPRSSLLYPRVKGELEQALAGLGFSQLYLFQPSLLLGKRDEFRPREALGEPFVRAFRVVLGKTANRYLPIEGEKVAQAMLEAALSSYPEGCHRLRYKEMMALVNQSE